MNFKYLFGGCLVASVLAVVGCGSSDGSPGSNGSNGTDGQGGATGATGATGAPGSGGAGGATGASGADGTNGSNGADGANGATGAQGDQGEVGAGGAQGDAGHIGDIACGDSLITAEEWHSACNVTATPGYDRNGGLVCKAGQVQCRIYDVEGELVLKRVCFDLDAHTAVTVPGGTASTRCDEDLNCDGTADDTTNAGKNVALVRRARQYECPVSASNSSCDGTFLKGYCRNAAEHCLGVDTCLDLKLSNGQVVVNCGGDGNPVQTFVHGNREGVTLSDFGDLSVATDDEAKMGFECVSGQDVKTWDCTIDGSGVAAVTCSGPRGL